MDVQEEYEQSSASNGDDLGRKVLSADLSTSDLPPRQPPAFLEHGLIEPPTIVS